MRIVRPLTFILVVTLALVLPHGASLEVAAQTECVQPLASVSIEGSWNSDCPSENRDNAYAHFYTFTLTQQVEVTITLESETDPYLFLLDHTGEIIDENDDIDTSGRNYNSRIIRTLAPGDYTIEATTYDQPANGDLTLTVAGIGPARRPSRPHSPIPRH